MNEVLKLDHAQFVAIIATLVPEPSDRAVGHIMDCEKSANPHNDSYKPKLRGNQEIRASLRVKEALSIVDEVYMQIMTKESSSTTGGLRR